MLTTDGVLVVVGYPELFALSSTWNAINLSYYESVSAADADMLAGASAHLDRSLRAAVDAARSKLTNDKIVYQSLLDLYRDHGLCGRKLLYLNGFQLGGNLESLARPDISFHPNRDGHKYTAPQLRNVAQGRRSPEAGQRASHRPGVT
jgi:hypothetical protein